MKIESLITTHVVDLDGEGVDLPQELLDDLHEDLERYLQGYIPPTLVAEKPRREFHVELVCLELGDLDHVERATDGLSTTTRRADGR